MNIFFVISACLWTLLVGRTIAFGPKCSVITWVPDVGAGSWYSLTPLTGKMPTALIVCMPIVFILFSVPTLFLNNTLTHSIMVIMMVSEQCYIPIFVTRIYDGMPQWPAIQITMYTLLLYTINNPVVIVSITIKIIIWTWFLWIEFKIKNKIIREELPYIQRQPRTV
jgi:hypothetical protein